MKSGLKRPYLLIILAFAVSRALYYWAGVRFDTEALKLNFQFIDLDLLRSRLFESVYYFHMQPPLMNLVIGTCLKISSTYYAAVLHGLHMLLGLFSGVLLYRTMVYLNVGSSLAVTLTILFLVSPGCVIYENFPMYEYIIMFLLLSSGVCLYSVMQQPSTWKAFLFFSLLAILVWIRSLYHPMLLLAIAGLIGINPKLRKVVLLGVIVPFLVALVPYVKNSAVFGVFTSSTWLGYALATCTIHQLTAEEREALIQAGRISPLARVEAPSPVVYYRPFFPDLKPTGIPVLDQESKGDGGGMNTNNLVYLKAEPTYRKDSLQVLRYAPNAYARSVAIAWFCYFLPPTDFFQFHENRAAVQPIERWVNAIIFGQIMETSRKGLRELKEEGEAWQLPLYTGLVLMVMIPFLLTAAAWLLWRGIRRGSLTPAQIALFAYILFNILFLMLTTNFLSSFENNRYRFPSDPLYIVLLAVVLQWMMGRFKSSKASA